MTRFFRHISFQWTLVFLALCAPVRSAEIYSATTTLSQSGSVASSSFTLNATTKLVSRVVSDYAVDGGIFTPANYNAFANGQATSGWAIFSSENGVASVTLAPGSYVVAVRNSTDTANTTRFELDVDHNIRGESRINSQTEVDSVGPNGNLVQPFTIPSGQTVYIDGANTGLEFYMIPASEIIKFQNDATFLYYSTYGSGEDSSQPGGYSVNLPPGNYALAFRNLKSVAKSLTYTIEWWTGGTSNPPATPPSISNHPSSQSLVVGQNASFSVTASGTSPFAYQWRKNGVSIPGATSSTYSITSVSASHAGSYSVVVSNSAGSATSNSASLVVNSASTAFSSLSIEAGNLSWTTGGSAPWVNQTANTHDGVDAARSGTIGHSQATWIQTTVTGPGLISFWWRVSSESGYDFLEFLYDGVAPFGAISGETAWSQLSYNIPAGTHTLQWRYRKDVDNSSGQDAGAVDQVSWTPSGSPPAFAGGSSVSGTVGQGFTYTLPFSNTPVSYAMTTALPGGLSLNTATGAISGTPTTAGSFTVSASATNAAGSGAGSFTIAVAKGSQIISFSPLAGKLTTDPAFSLSASSSAPLAVGFSRVSGPASVSGTTVTLTGAPGTVVIRASQTGNGNYNAATPIDRSFDVSTPFDNFLVSAGIPAGQRGEGDDPDKDGINNLLEYALGGNPTLAARSILPTFTPPSAATGQKLVFKYRRSLAAVGVTSIAQYTDALASPWSAAVHGVGGVTLAAAAINATTEEVTVTIPAIGPRRFVRLKVTR